MRQSSWHRACSITVGCKKPAAQIPASWCLVGQPLWSPSPSPSLSRPAHSHSRRLHYLLSVPLPYLHFCPIVAHPAYIVFYVHHLFVYGFGLREPFLESHYYSMYPAFDAIASSIVQAFFTYRCWRLLKRQWWIVVVLTVSQGERARVVWRARRRASGRARVMTGPAW